MIIIITINFRKESLIFILSSSPRTTTRSKCVFIALVCTTPRAFRIRLSFFYIRVMYFSLLNSRKYVLWLYMRRDSVGGTRITKSSCARIFYNLHIRFANNGRSTTIFGNSYTYVRLICKKKNRKKTKIKKNKRSSRSHKTWRRRLQTVDWIVVVDIFYRFICVFLAANMRFARILWFNVGLTNIVTTVELRLWALLRTPRRARVYCIIFVL